MAGALKPGRDRAGAYLRLSREDGDKPESNSIAGQRELIRGYLEGFGMRAEREYVDDGYSGTNFERPAFRRMLEDCRAGRINCIVAKDLSRLGRNYIETGRYLERVFPLMGIRFIAVTDHYDSFQSDGAEDDIIVPFKNLINDTYCRDISVKVRSQLDLKRRNGDFIGSFAAFGYVKDPENRNRLLIDGPAADVVRLIFRLKIGGRNQQAIADYLNGIGAETPFGRKRSLGYRYDTLFAPAGEAAWSAPAVRRILENELYLGTTVQGKSRKASYKVAKRLRVEKEDWIRVEGTHEPIVTPEEFGLAQELLARDTRTPPGRDGLYLLSGFLRCGDCGANMGRKQGKVRGKTYCYYRCNDYSRRLGCTPHSISEGKLLAAVTEAARARAAVLAEAEEAIKGARRSPGRHAYDAIDARMKALLDECGRYRDLRAGLYRDQAEGLVSREEYRDMDARFAEKIRAAEDAIEALRKKREGMADGKDGLLPWLESVRKLGDVKELTREALACLVDHVDVYEGHRIEVRFRFEDETRELLETEEKRT